jgi:hypothetical protein
MIWIVGIIVGSLLIKLGALSVLVTVLSVSVKFAIVVVAFLGLLMLILEHRR